MEFETYAFSHIIGAFYGQALGDAWAMPAYFHPEQTWEYFGGWLDQMRPAPADHPLHAGFQIGQVTDNTKLAVALAQAIIADGQVTAEGAVKALVSWYDQLDGDHSPLLSADIRRFVNALKSGADSGLASLDCQTYLGAIGISPVGLIHAGNPDAAITDAIIVCSSPYFTSVAVSGACAVAAAVAQALSPDTTLEEIIDVAIQGAQIGFRRGRPGLGASVARKIDLAVNWALQADLSVRDRLQNLHDLIGSTLSAADIVPCAFGVLALGNGNPVDTAIYAANLSGKADTAGAIACAIAGAWQTIDVIPMEYIDILSRANPQLNFAETAEDLFEVAKNNYRALPQDETDGLITSFLDEMGGG